MPSYERQNRLRKARAKAARADDYAVPLLGFLAIITLLSSILLLTSP